MKHFLHLKFKYLFTIYDYLIMTSLKYLFRIIIVDQSSFIPHYISFEDMNWGRAYDFGLTERNLES